ncbi:MAG: hypothetical protein KC420_17485 [Myxococcales bacterium]|nr:hypothetical protein [Myxococcales bacterium]
MIQDEAHQNVRAFPMSSRTGRLRSPLRVHELTMDVLDLLEGGPADTLVLPVWSDERPLTGLAALVDWRACGQLSANLRRGLTTGAHGESTLTLTRGIPSAWRMVLVGLGPRGDLDREGAEAAGDHLYEVIRRLGARRVILGVPSGRRDPTLPLVLVEALFERLGADALAADDPRDAPVWWAIAEPELIPYIRAIAEGRSPSR